MLMMGLYRGLLLSQLLHPIDLAPFSSAEEMVELIASNQFHLVTNYISNWFLFP
jgi:hypothetical protein